MQFSKHVDVEQESLLTSIATVNCVQVTRIILSTYQQEGQHPLTGQRAAKFRLLANQ